jgi:hypothetical protein
MQFLRFLATIRQNACQLDIIGKNLIRVQPHALILLAFSFILTIRAEQGQNQSSLWVNWWQYPESLSW